MKSFYTAILALFLLTLSLNGKAQVKYEYGQIAYSMYGSANGKGYSIATSIGAEYKIVAEGKIADGNSTTNFTPVNKVLNDLADQGWEVYSVNISARTDISYYYIKKKKG